MLMATLEPIKALQQAVTSATVVMTFEHIPGTTTTVVLILVRVGHMPAFQQGVTAIQLVQIRVMRTTAPAKGTVLADCQHAQCMVTSATMRCKQL